VPIAARGRARATVSLLRRCDNACVVCGLEGVPRDGPRGEDEVRAAMRAARPLHHELTFVGGEPLLDPSLVDHVAHARALGFRRVGVQTNGRRLASRELVARLAGAGLTDVHVTLHGAEAAVHDYHTGVDGAFAQTMAGVVAARAQGLQVVAATVLTRSNFRVIGALPRLLATRGIAAWTVTVPHARGRAAISAGEAAAPDREHGFDRVMPRLGLAVPFALHAIAAARAASLPAWIGDAPRCLLGPMGAHSLAIGPPRAFGEACEGCPAREGCPGVDATYLARFGGDELAPRPVAAEIVDARELRALFVGPGELAPAPETTDAQPIAQSPAKARVSLPQLGKVQPARAEVPKSAGKKTGEALREILPTLFDAERRVAPREGRG
jgi:organic radical activating enzyme